MEIHKIKVGILLGTIHFVIFLLFLLFFVWVFLFVVRSARTQSLYSLTLIKPSFAMRVLKCVPFFFCIYVCSPLIPHSIQKHCSRKLPFLAIVYNGQALDVQFGFISSSQCVASYLSFFSFLCLSIFSSISPAFPRFLFLSSYFLVLPSSLLPFIACSLSRPYALQPPRSTIARSIISSVASFWKKQITFAYRAKCFLNEQ